MIESINSNEKLQRIFQADAEPPLSEGDCPSPDQLWAAAALELTPAERRAVIDHTARCAACAEDFRAIAQMVREAPADDVADDEKEAKGVLVQGPWISRPTTRWMMGSLAATLLVAILLATWFDLLPARNEPGVYRGGPSEQIRSLLGPETVLERGNAVLRWQGPAGARYRVTLTSADLHLLLEATGLEQTSYQIPAEVLAPYPTGTRLSWRVEATLEDAGQLASATFHFRLE